MRKWIVVIFPLFIIFVFVSMAYAQGPCVDNSLSGWQETTPIEIPNNIGGLIGYNGFLYFPVVNSTDGLTTTVLYTSPLSDGTILGWQKATSTINAYPFPTLVISGTDIYITGKYASTTEKATINQDGSLGKWEETTEEITKSDYAYFNEYYYNYDSYTGLVSRSTDQSNWMAVNRLTPVHYLPAIGGLGDYLYIIGGNIGGVLTNTVAYWDTTTPPIPSEYGVSINDGSLFTNDVNVVLTIGQPALWNKLVEVSNDGGFSGAAWQSHQTCKPWTITQYGSYIIPRTVYIRFKDSSTGELSATYSDDIILDVTAPTGSVTLENAASNEVNASTIANQANYTIYFPLFLKNGARQNVMLRLTATDDVSGVGYVMIANNIGFTGSDWESYSLQKSWYVPDGETVYVKYKDFAGNISGIYSAKKN